MSGGIFNLKFKLEVERKEDRICVRVKDEVVRGDAVLHTYLFEIFSQVQH